MSQLLCDTRWYGLSLHYPLEHLGRCCENNVVSFKITVKTKDFKGVYTYILIFAILNQVVDV